MHVTIHRAILTLGAFAATACASDRSTAPAAAVAGAAMQPAAATLVCDFTQAKSDARAFFASSTDPVFTILRDMQGVYKTGGANAATSKGFDALQRIAAARGTSAQGGTSAAGGALTNDLLGCMNVGPVPDSFNPAAALASGIYEVRGGASDNAGPALAQIASAGQKSAASPLWGIEPVTAWGARFNGAATRFLVYGAPLANNFGEPASVSGNAAVTGFDVSTIPAMPGLALVDGNGATLNVRVGICIDPVTGSVQNRLLHQGTFGTTILQLDAPAFCGSVASNRIAPSGGLLASLARGVLALVTPAPAYAFAFGGVGGIPSGLSPFGPVQVDASTVQLTFTQQPSNGSISAPISPPVAVKATTAAGSPIGGVEIVITVQGNNGINAFVTDSSAVTDELGIATFPDLKVTKAGGYTVRAVGQIGGSATMSVISNLFNVKNQ
jgi:hypothetical protein